jgi:hypothetical protein
MHRREGADRDSAFAGDTVTIGDSILDVSRAHRPSCFDDEPGAILSRSTMDHHFILAFSFIFTTGGRNENRTGRRARAPRPSRVRSGEPVTDRDTVTSLTLSIEPVEAELLKLEYSHIQYTI